MSEYYAITLEEMTAFMIGRGFDAIKIDGTHEVVFAKTVPEKADLEIRVFTSIDGRGEARDVGDDAIRVVIYSPKYKRGVGSDARVYRVKGWGENLDNRLFSIFEQARTGLALCPACGAYMLERSGKNGRPFFGCVTYPACKGTVSIAPKGMTDDDMKCDCGAPMRIRTGARGDFLGCSKYPACRVTRSLPRKAV